MNCTSALRLLSYRSLLVSPKPLSRTLTALPSQFTYRTYVTEAGTRKKEKEKKKGKKAQGEEEDVEENALSTTDEVHTAPAPVPLRHQHRNPIPGFNDKSEINEDASKQRDVQIRQEQIREKKKEILKRVQTLATMDTTEFSEEVRYNSIEEAYASLKQEFDDALAMRRVDEAYEVITSMRGMGLRLPKNSYDDAAVLFAEEQHIYKVRDVWEFMTRDEMFPDQQSFMNVVKVYSNMTQYEWAMKAFFAMCERLCPSPEAYEEVLDLFSKNTHIGNLRKAEQIFHTIHRFDVKHTPKSCASFIRLLCSSGYEGDGDRAVDILKYMKAKVIGPIPEEVPGYIVTHLKKFAIPEHQFIRTKKVLRGCQHGGLPDEPFKELWEIVNSKRYVRSLNRADVAAPIDKMDFTRKDNKNMRVG